VGSADTTTTALRVALALCSPSAAEAELQPPIARPRSATLPSDRRILLLIVISFSDEQPELVPTRKRDDR
jgi:hypothetical protein